jgi:hypothetical protein
MSAALIQDLFIHAIHAPRAPRHQTAHTHASGGSRFLPLSVVPYTGMAPTHHIGAAPKKHPAQLARAQAHVQALMHPHARSQHTGQYTTSDPNTGDSASSNSMNTTVAPLPPGGDPGTSSASSLLSGLLGAIGIDPSSAAAAAGDGTTTTPTDPGSVATAATTTSSSTSQSNVDAQGNVVYNAAPSGGGGGSTALTPSTPGTALAPTSGGGSHLIWWIVGGVAAVGIIWLAWRMFGHKGAAVATSNAVKAAAYYGMR